MDTPSHNEVVFPKIEIRNFQKYKEGDYQTRLRELHLTKPRNFVFKDGPVDALKHLRAFFEDLYVESVKNRFIANMFLMDSTETKNVKEKNSALYHQMYSLLEEHIELLEKLRNYKKNKRERYQRNKSEREKNEREKWKSQYSTTRGFLVNKEDVNIECNRPDKSFFRIEITPV
jgi:hypothetical protein